VWQLNIAIEKCFTGCITSNRMSTTVLQHRYMIIDKVLDTVETVRDLGVIVDHRLKFDAHMVCLFLLSVLLVTPSVIVCSLFCYRGRIVVLLVAFSFLLWFVELLL